MITGVYAEPTWGMILRMFLGRLSGFIVTFAVLVLIWRVMDRWQK